jgi:hypothetical protein
MSGYSTKVTSLPANKRYICSHDSSGKSIFLSSPDQLYRGSPGAGGVAKSFSVGSVPAVLKNDEDVKKYLDANATTNPMSYKAADIVVPNTTQSPNGANLLVVDLAPGGESQMHRTVSIDFSICVLGSIDMELDSGERVNLSPGVSSLVLTTCVFKHTKFPLGPYCSARYIA